MKPILRQDFIETSISNRATRIFSFEILHSLAGSLLIFEILFGYSNSIFEMFEYRLNDIDLYELFFNHRNILITDILPTLTNFSFLLNIFQLQIFS